MKAPIAQLVEQIPLKDKVEGSIPSGRTFNFLEVIRQFFVCSFLQDQS